MAGQEQISGEPAVPFHHLAHEMGDDETGNDGTERMNVCWTDERERTPALQIETPHLGMPHGF